MEAIMTVIAIVVAVLAVLQGWQMFMARKMKKNGNPGNSALQNGLIGRLDNIASKLGVACTQLNTTCSALTRMEQRLNDIWDEVKKD